jgi:hypothetical protein
VEFVETCSLCWVICTIHLHPVARTIVNVTDIVSTLARSLHDLPSHCCSGSIRMPGAQAPSVTLRHMASLCGPN